MEVELQYVYGGDAPPMVPTRLADLELAGSAHFSLLDTYYDTDGARPATERLLAAGQAVRRARFSRD